MEVTDQAKAREALSIIGIVCFAEIGLMILSQFLPTVAMSLMGSSSDAIWRFYGAQQLLWFFTTVAVAIAIFMLTRSVKQPDLLFALLGGLGLVGCFELYSTFDAFTRGMSSHRSIEWLGYASLAIGLGVNIGLCVVIGRLGRLMPFAMGVAVYFAVRSLITLGMRSTENHPPAWVYTVLSLMSMAASGALGALALHARKNVSGPPLAAAGGPLSSEVAVSHAEPGGARLLITGLALLLVGIGVTAASFSAASGGGTYVVATGAIATGIVQVVRGLARLGK